MTPIVEEYTLRGLRSELEALDTALSLDTSETVIVDGEAMPRYEATSERDVVVRQLARLEDEAYQQLTGRKPSRPQEECIGCRGRGRIKCRCTECDQEHERQCGSCSGFGKVIWVS